MAFRMDRLKDLVVGIYDNPNAYSIKIESILRNGKNIHAVLYFTNNEGYGKSRFGLENKGLELFMRGYKKRKGDFKRYLTNRNMSTVRIPIKITGVSNLGTWTITRFLDYTPNECQLELVNRLIKNFSNYSNYSNWEIIEWDYPIRNLVEREWYEKECLKNIGNKKELKN